MLLRILFSLRFTEPRLRRIHQEIISKTETNNKSYYDHISISCFFQFVLDCSNVSISDI